MESVQRKSPHRLIEKIKSQFYEYIEEKCNKEDSLYLWIDLEEKVTEKIGLGKKINGWGAKYIAQAASLCKELLQSQLDSAVNKIINNKAFKKRINKLIEAEIEQTLQKRINTSVSSKINEIIEEEWRKI